MALGDYLDIKCHACIGGTRVREDMRLLDLGVHVIVGTPGRVSDMIERRALNVNSIKMFVLDEADEMLSRGFKDQIYDVFRKLPSSVQVSNHSGTSKGNLKHSFGRPGTPINVIGEANPGI